PFAGNDMTAGILVMLTTERLVRVRLSSQRQGGTKPVVIVERNLCRSEAPAAVPLVHDTLPSPCALGRFVVEHECARRHRLHAVRCVSEHHYGSVGVVL